MNAAARAPGRAALRSYGVGAPHDTPQAIIDLLNTEVNAALDDSLIKRQIAELGAVPITGNARQCGDMLAAETEHWRGIVERAGLRKE